MIGLVEFDKNGKVVDDAITVSLFQPEDDVKVLTAAVKDDYTIGHNLMTDSYREFNDLSLFDRQDRDQKAFNSYVSPASEDPDEAWHYNGVSPLSRTKAMTMAGHVTARLLYPNVFAQNDMDNSDKVWASAMKDMILWNIENSDYEMSFFFGVIAALVNPCAWIKQDYTEALQKVRTKLADGTIEIKEAIDDVFTGMNFANIPADEILIANIREYEVQKQRFLIRRRFIGFQEAQSKWGDHKNFEFVQAGVKTFYNDQDGLFYDQKESDLDAHQVEEVIYYNRQEDMEVAFINSIYLGEDDIQDNAMTHRNNKGKPSYQFVKFGFSPIDEKQFFYYKSLMFSLENEQDLIDTMTRMTVDGSFLDVMTPIGTSGPDSVDSSVIFPGSVTSFDKETKIFPLRTGNNLSAGYQVIQSANDSANKVQSDILSGTPEGGQKTAFQVSREETNARIQLGAFGKLVGSAVKDLGYLIIDDVIRHQTTPMLDEIVGENTSLQYKTFLLSEQTVDGKKVTKKIRFTDKFLGVEDNDERRLKDSFRLMKEEGGIDGEERIIEINPVEFANLRFKITINPDNLLPQSEMFEKALKLEAWDRMILSPFADREAIDRDFLFETFTKGESNKYMKKASEVLGTPEQPGVQKKSSDLVGQITGGNNLSDLITS